MPKVEHFPNAPITEAVLDIRAEVKAGVTHHALGAIHEAIGATYPIKEVREEWEGAFELQPGQGPRVVSNTKALAGYLFRSSDRRQVVQARMNGFSFHRLPPYTDWAEFSKTAQSLWLQYVAVAKPQKIVRIALRYINRLELPIPADTKDYLLTGPEIAPGLPQELANFFFKVAIPDRERQAMVVITSATPEERPNKSTFPVILDIDVFRNGAFPVDAAKLWPLFEDLHNLKNDAFFKSVTEKAKELFR